MEIGPGMYAQSQGPCEECHGAGDTMIEEDKCEKCKGEKILEEKNEIMVKLEPGVPENHFYTFEGEGHEVVKKIR